MRLIIILFLSQCLTGASNENGNVPEDSETIPDQTPAQAAEVVQPVHEVVASTDGAATTAVPPAEEEESQQATAAPESATTAQNPEENPGPAEAAGPIDAAAASAVQTAAESSGEPAAAPADDQGRRSECNWLLELQLRINVSS